jgi:glycosyltransferase involved in cell wall biosynthesis
LTPRAAAGSLDAVRIAVDARILEFPCPTGVERAATEILRALPAALKVGDEIVLFGHGAVVPPSGPSPRVRSVALGGPEAPMLWRESRLVEGLREHGADVLWSPVAALPVRGDVPRVATVHEAPWLVRPGMEGLIREQAHKIRLRIAVEVASRIVCPSRSAAAQVAQMYPAVKSRLRVVPYGVPSAFFAPPDECAAAGLRLRAGVEGPYLLHVGGTRERKNVPLLLRAYARYLLQGGRAALVLAGPGEPPERTPRGVRHAGYVSDETLVALYDGAEAVVVSSDSEGFGIPVIEAMARGVPVVATSAGGVPEAAGGAAVLVPPGDDEAFAAALRELEGDAARRAELVERGRVRAASCRFADSAARLYEVLAEAAA